MAEILVETLKTIEKYKTLSPPLYRAVRYLERDTYSAGGISAEYEADDLPPG